MLILEGPDGAGKTTLLHTLLQRTGLSQGPRASSSLGGPVDNLRNWVDADLHTWRQKPTEIYDRYPLISETIYRPVLDHTMREHFDGTWLRERTNYFRPRALVIFCLPPLPTVLTNLNNEDQMKGVAENIRTLYWLYHVKAQQWEGDSLIYDYTQPDALAPVIVETRYHAKVNS